jgi:predicted phosphoribosyltransferase
MFSDRAEAGKRLAEALHQYRGQEAIVYALPRGGVVVGAEVARALELPLDLVIVRKVGHPMQPEYAIGAVSEDGELIADSQEVAQVDPDWLESAAAEQVAEARRRRSLYLRGRRRMDARGKIAIVVDDGLATGLTMEAAIRQLRKRRAAKIVAAVPVAAPDTAHRLRSGVDELVVLEVPHGWFGAIGSYYRDFEQVSDDEVVALLGAELCT